MPLLADESLNVARQPQCYPHCVCRRMPFLSHKRNVNQVTGRCLPASWLLNVEADHWLCVLGFAAYACRWLSATSAASVAFKRPNSGLAAFQAFLRAGWGTDTTNRQNVALRASESFLRAFRAGPRYTIAGRKPSATF